MVRLLLQVGSRVDHKIYGLGTVEKIDEKDVNFRYLIVFDDGSKSWLANWQILKEVKVLGQKEDNRV